MAKFVVWPHVHTLRNLHWRCVAQQIATGTDGLPVIYRAKVKLHGSNAGVIVTDADVRAQSHHHLLARNSGRGAAAFATTHEMYFRRLWLAAKRDSPDLKQLTVFGEWAGKGVQKFVAVSAADPFLAVFGVLFLHADGSTRLLTEPAAIAALLPVDDKPANLHVLPWVEGTWALCPSELASVAAVEAAVQPLVEAIDHACPWARDVLRLDGAGEGLVFYPQDDAHDFARFGYLAFKAKGKTHLGPKQINKLLGLPEVKEADPSIVDLLGALALGPRVEQAVDVLREKYPERDPNKRDTAEVVAWVSADVDRECGAEIAAAGLEDGKLPPAARKLLKTTICHAFHNLLLAS
jgi:hypothetical protein